MEIVSPMKLSGNFDSLQIICHVPADCNGKDQSHAYPEGPIQVWIWPDVRYKVIITTMWYHGSLKPFQDITCIDIEILLIVLNRPEAALRVI